MKIRFKKLTENAVIPTKAHPTDAGFDLTATSMHIDAHGAIVYGTGIAIELPEGYCATVHPRSSIAKYDLVLSNSVGLIDCHYRGEIMAKFKPVAKAYPFRDRVRQDWRIDPKVYNIGDRIAQLVLHIVPQAEFVESDELTSTDRGEGGYGSTGE